MVLLSKPAWQKPGCCFKHHIHTIINTNLQSARLISSQIRRYLLEGNAGCDEGIPFWMCFYSHTGRDRVKAPVPHARSWNLCLEHKGPGCCQPHALPCKCSIPASPAWFITPVRNRKSAFFAWQHHGRNVHCMPTCKLTPCNDEYL